MRVSRGPGVSWGGILGYWDGYGFFYHGPSAHHIAHAECMLYAYAQAQAGVFLLSIATEPLFPVNLIDLNDVLLSILLQCGAASATSRVRVRWPLPVANGHVCQSAATAGPPVSSKVTATATTTNSCLPNNTTAANAKVKGWAKGPSPWRIRYRNGWR